MPNLSFRLITTLATVGYLVGSAAYAKPLHIRFKSVGAEKAPAAHCVFPDNTAAPQEEAYCYTPAQVAHAYGFDVAHQQGITGKGQTIIIVSALGSPTAQQDLDHFSDAFNLPRTQIEFVYPQGTYLNPASTNDQQGWASETSLDLQWSHAMAPDAKIVNIVTNHTETEGLDGFRRR
jgi:subtilase family serine protease